MSESLGDLPNISVNQNYYGDGDWQQITRRFNRHRRIFGLHVASVAAEAPVFDLETGDIAGRKPTLGRRIMFRLGF